MSVIIELVFVLQYVTFNKTVVLDWTAHMLQEAQSSTSIIDGGDLQ